MQKRTKTQNRDQETRVRRVSLDLTNAPQSVVLELKMMEAIERIERLRSKTLMAVGTMLATGK